MSWFKIRYGREAVPVSYKPVDATRLAQNVRATPGAKHYFVYKLRLLPAFG